MTAILVDASGYIYRAFYVQPTLVRTDGTPVGCIHGYLRMLWNLKKRHAGDTHFGVIFDKGRCATRTALHPGYKANRPPIPEDMRIQLSMIRDATRAFGIPVVEQDNVEADDLIASYAAAFRANGDDVLIVSADKDMFQLLDDEDGLVAMYDPVKERMIEPADVVAKLGVGPRLAIDAQALIGDATDNVPGVPKIGVKTAGALLAQFGSLDAVLDNWQAITQRAVRDSIMLNRDKALLSRDLVTLNRHLPLPLPLKALEAKDVTVGPLLAFCQEMEFASLGADIAAFYQVNA